MKCVRVCVCGYTLGWACLKTANPSLLRASDACVHKFVLGVSVSKIQYEFISTVTTTTLKHCFNQTHVWCNNIKVNIKTTFAMHLLYILNNNITITFHHTQAERLQTRVHIIGHFGSSYPTRHAHFTISDSCNNYPSLAIPAPFLLNYTSYVTPLRLCFLTA